MQMRVTELVTVLALGACATPVELESNGGIAGAPGAGGSGGVGSSGGSVASGGVGAVGGSAALGGSGGSAALGGTGGSGSLGGAGGSAALGGAGGSGGSVGGAGGSAEGSGAGAGGSGVGGTGGASCVPPVPGGLCDPVTQCGCASGLNCDVQGPSGFTACGPAGPKLQNQVCNVATECSTGTSCVGYSCKPFCKSIADCPLSGSSCVQVYMGTPVPGWYSCTAGCELHDPAARCGAGTTCMVVLPDIADCIGVAGVGIGPGTCVPGNDLACAPGHGCANGTCAKWCRIGQNDCPAGSTCTSQPLAATAAGVAYGTCAP